MLSLSILSLIASSPRPSNTTPVAPGVFLPNANVGGVHDFPSNYSLWLELGGRGLDT